jgi:hypothetical protein
MVQNDRWLTGPKFLKESESEWPRLQEIPILKDEDPQFRKETQIYAVSVQGNGLDDIISFYSNWWKLKRAVGWWLRYKQYLQRKVQERSNTTSYEHQRRYFGYLTLSELDVAEREILKRVQLTAFPAVFHLLSNSNRPAATTKKMLRKAGTSIHQLNPILKEGLLCVGGRLDYAQIDDHAKHPFILLPYKHHITDMIIRYYHIIVGHMGQESVLSSLRQVLDHQRKICCSTSD